MFFKKKKSEVKELENRIFEKVSSGVYVGYASETLEKRIMYLERDNELLMKYLGIKVGHTVKDEYQINKIKPIKK